MAPATLKLANAGILRDARGLADGVWADVRPQLFTPADTVGAPARDDGTIELVPGEETAITVAAGDVPRNADLKRLRATLTVAPSTATHEPERTAVALTSAAASAQSFTVAVTPQTLPRNVQVRLDGGEPFWDHAGTLVAGEHDLPDFAAAANRFLDEVELATDAETAFTFLVRSETPGRLKVTLDGRALEYTTLQTQAWQNPLDGSLRIDRNLTLDFATELRIPLDPPPARRRARSVRLDVSGEVGPERLLGDVPAHDGRVLASVGGDYAVAQQLRLSELGFPPETTHARLAGVALLAAVDAETELYVEIRGEERGAPDAGAPVGGVNFTLAPGATGPWAYAAFPAPLEVAVGKPHWIVLRGIRGAARVAVGARGPDSALGALLVNRGGRLWKPFARDAVALLARVSYLPEPDSGTAPVTIAIAGAASQLPELTPQVQQLTLDVPGDGPVTLVLTAHARGTVALANVVQELEAAA